jgi:hypothetical protein
MFRRKILALSSESNNSQAKYQHEVGSKVGVLANCFTLVSCLAYLSILKVEAICSSETSVDSQWTARRYIPKDSTLHN